MKQHEAHTRLRLTRRGRCIFTLFGVVVLCGAFFVSFALPTKTAVAATDDAGASFEYVSVVAGQSLWSLARQVAPDADPRDVIAEIATLNGLGKLPLEPGQRLAIPLRYSAK